MLTKNARPARRPPPASLDISSKNPAKNNFKCDIYFGSLGEMATMPIYG